MDRRPAHVPAIDGLRALAVTAVLLYHARPAILPGGFLGVEVFFVISGFLITSLLLSEWEERRTISLAGFWLRRARRLLPAVLFMLVALLAVAVLVLPEEVLRLRREALASFGYVTNWYLIFHDQPYFESFSRPSLLRHLWSLAVEEQFYLLWPLVFVAGMTVLRQRLMPVALIAGAIASAVLMAALYDPNADPARVYYGTDTRASGLLLGAALAFFLRPGWNTQARSAAVGTEVLGIAALGALGWLHWSLDERDPLLYRGGFFLVGLATAALIANAARERSRLGGLLSITPLQWLGTRSYSIYLWHWPVFVLTGPEMDVPVDGAGLFALRIAITLALAELTYRAIEAPFRAGSLGRTLGRVGARLHAPGWKFALPSAAAASLVACAVALGVAVTRAEAPAAPDYLSVSRIQTGFLPAPAGGAKLDLIALRPTPTPRPSPPPRRQGQTVSTRPAVAPPATAKAPEALPTATAARRAPAPKRVTALGDSVMVGAAAQLTSVFDEVNVDAEIGRQASDAVDLLRTWSASGQLGEVVILQIGNNGYVTGRQVDDLMEAMAGARLVLVVNVKVPREWEGPNNAVLAQGVERHTNSRLVDWHAAATDRPDLFWNDGTHLRPKGAQLYTWLIASALAMAPAADGRPSN